MLDSRDSAVADAQSRRGLATVFIPLTEIEARTHLHMSPPEWETLFRRAGFALGESIDVQAMRARGELTWWDQQEQLLVIGRVDAIRKVRTAKKLIAIFVDHSAQKGPYLQVLTSTQSLVYFKRRPRWLLPELHVPYAAVGAKVVKATSSRRPRPFMRMKVAHFLKQPSYGMVCSECEVGLGDFHDDIFLLPNEARVGTALASYLGEYTLRLYFSLRQRRHLSLAYISRRLLAVHKAH